MPTVKRPVSGVSEQKSAHDLQPRFDSWAAHACLMERVLGCYAARLFQIIYPENVEAVSGVSHTAIVENKRLGHALTIAKAQQDFERETKVMTNSEKTG